MGLADYTPERREVTSTKGALVITVFSVRGLSLDDCSLLVRSNMDGLNLVLDLAKKATEPFGSVAFFMEAIQQAPNLMFDIIAIAADEVSYGEMARKLPVGLQIKALQQIVELTLEDIGGPKSAVALVQKLLGSKKLLPASTDAT